MWPFNGNLVGTTQTGITVSDVRPDAPEFRRIYAKKLDHRAVCEIEMKTFLGRRGTGTLTQPDGNRVWFEPEAIANRILDPTLVPLVQAFVSEVFRIDREWIRSNPNEFTDKTGAKWRRV